MVAAISGGLNAQTAKRFNFLKFALIFVLTAGALGAGAYFLLSDYNPSSSKIVYNVGGVSADIPDGHSEDSDGRYGDLPVPAADNFDFAGWYKEADYINRVTTYAEGAGFSLFAKWTYNVTFDTAGKTVAVQGAPKFASAPKDGAYTQTAVMGVAGPLPWTSERPSSAGGIFVNWKKPDGSRVSDFLNLTEGHITLTAVWANGVTFDFNGVATDAGAELLGGMSGLPVTQTLSGGESGNLPAPLSSKFSFGGWYSVNGLGGTFDEAKRVLYYDELPAGNPTLYAKWMFRVAFDVRGVGADIEEKTFALGASGAVPAHSAVGADATKWSFGGWYSSYSSATNAYENKVTDYSALTSGHATLYAKWLYTVTYAQNGHGDAYLAAPVVKVKGDAGALADPGASSAAGMVFGGWFLDDGTFKNKVTNYSALVGGNVTLYAQWGLGIVFDTNGVAASNNADDSSGDFTVILWREITGALPVASAAGWTFSGWYTENGVNGVFSETKRVLNFEDLPSGKTAVCYAKWIFRVSFAMNGAGTQIAYKDVVKGYSAAVPTQTEAGNPTTWTLEGWYASYNPSTNSFNNAIKNYSALVSGNITLYAHWVWSIAFNTNGVAAANNAGRPAGDFSLVVGKGAAGLLPALTHAAWTFGGWFKTAALTGAVSNYSEISSETTVLYAKWTYTVTFAMNGVGTQIGAITLGKSASGALPAQSATGNPTGWTLEGWYTANAPSGGRFDTAAKVTDYSYLSAGSVTLYARWTYVVSFELNANGAALNPAAVTMDKGEAGSIPSPTYRGSKAFAGWHTANASGGVFDVSKKVSNYRELNSGNITLYARFDGMASVISMSAGLDGALAADANGRLWAWGSNAFGQSGTGENEETKYYSPQFADDYGFVKVVTGGGMSFGIDKDGSLWAWGFNLSGNLGLGNEEFVGTPQRINSDAAYEKPISNGKPISDGVVYEEVSAGWTHALALDNGGNLWAWGDQTFFGQLGLGGNAETAYDTPQRVDERKYSAIAAGATHSLAIDYDGNLWAWGDNTCGELGLGDFRNRNVPTKLPALNREKPVKFVSVSAGWHTSFALDSQGNLWAWGDNSFGRLGIGDASNGNAPTQVSGKYKAVSSGHYHTLALSADGSLYGWGSNARGELGLGAVTGCAAPQKIGNGKYTAVSAGNASSNYGGFSLVLDEEGALWAFGANGFGQLGLGGATGDILTPQRVA